MAKVVTHTCMSLTFRRRPDDHRATVARNEDWNDARFNGSQRNETIPIRGRCPAQN
jgi:hypothetical protein